MTKKSLSTPATTDKINLIEMSIVFFTVLDDLYNCYNSLEKQEILSIVSAIGRLIGLKIEELDTELHSQKF
ncbi:hypothetical protein FWK35_00022483 [Aphis craccivora]|uniref:Uncharacterized protein n=1 Tax=Aphis craccivora TaxID=307492 RepID=A0A6G0Y930_APHCR|nr:hypothetical protein FWK35_00022483 [Aphis craccivora]